MSNLIDKNVLLKEYKKAHKGEPGGAYYLILYAPTVDAVPVQRGVWYEGPDSVIECSECHWFGKIEGYEYVYNFCPHCGADLREV